jgi:hypothetical protein
VTTRLSPLRLGRLCVLTWGDAAWRNCGHAPDVVGSSGGCYPKFHTPHVVAWVGAGVLGISHGQVGCLPKGLDGRSEVYSLNGGWGLAGSLSPAWLGGKE